MPSLDELANGGSSAAYFRLVFGRKARLQSDDVDLTYLLLGHNAYISRLKDRLIEAGEETSQIYAQAKAADLMLRGFVPDDLGEFIAHFEDEFLVAQEAQTTFLWMNDGSATGTKVRESGTDLYMSVPNSVIHLSVFLKRSVSRFPKGAQGQILSLGVVRLVHILRTIHSLLNTDRATEILLLSRTLLEIHALLFAAQDATLADEMWDAYNVPTKSGRLRPPSATAMLRRTGSPDLPVFELLYPELSGYVHLGLDVAHSYFPENVVDSEIADHDPFYRLFVVNFITFLIFDAMSRWPSAIGMARRDVRYHAAQLKAGLLGFARLMKMDRFADPAIQTLLQRLRSIS